MTATLPFIKLLESPLGGYFYDVGKNEVIRVSDDVYISEIFDKRRGYSTRMPYRWITTMN